MFRHQGIDFRRDQWHTAIYFTLCDIHMLVLFDKTHPIYIQYHLTVPQIHKTYKDNGYDIVKKVSVPVAVNNCKSTLQSIKKISGLHDAIVF